MQRHGVLTRLNAVFSRDGSRKRYVQHRFDELGGEVYRWFADREAVLYLCGNKRTMGRDVKTTLELIAAR